MSTYAFDNAWQHARQRLALLEQGLDPVTIRRMQAIDVAKGWYCLDVGAGGGSIAQWLCARVGPYGHVVATDLDTRFLDALAAPNLEVLRHNIVSDDLPIATYDLIHTRLVLMHIPEREQVLVRLVTALKPGGWLLLEEHDTFPILAVASGPYARVWEAFLSATAPAGSATNWARQLPSLLAQHGLTSVTADGDVPLFSRASATAEFWRLTWSQVRERILGAGETAEELDATLNLLRDPTQWFIGPALIGTWGCRAATG